MIPLLSHITKDKTKSKQIQLVPHSRINFKKIYTNTKELVSKKVKYLYVIGIQQMLTGMQGSRKI